MSCADAVGIDAEDDPDLARVHDVRDAGVLAVAVGEPVQDVQGHLDAHVLVGMGVAVEEDLGLVLVGGHVVGDLGRPQLATLVALADREPLDDVRVGGLDGEDVGGDLRVRVVALEALGEVARRERRRRREQRHEEEGDDEGGRRDAGHAALGVHVPMVPARRKGDHPYGRGNADRAGRPGSRRPSIRA